MTNNALFQRFHVNRDVGKFGQSRVTFTSGEGQVYPIPRYRLAGDGAKYPPACSCNPRKKKERNETAETRRRWRTSHGGLKPYASPCLRVSVVGFCCPGLVFSIPRVTMALSEMTS